MISRYFSSDLAQGGYIAGPSSLVASVGIFLLIDILGFGGGGVALLVSGSGGGDPGGVGDSGGSGRPLDFDLVRWEIGFSFLGGFGVRGYASGTLLDPAVLLIYIEQGSGLFDLDRRG